MSDWPDVPNDEPSDLLCSVCMADNVAARLFFALNTNRYVCTVHGPQLTGEMLYELTKAGRTP